MAWFGNVSLGNFPDLAGAVNKLSESVKNIEKNFDTALGLEEKQSSTTGEGIWSPASDSKTLFKPVMAFMGHREDESAPETSGNEESLEEPLNGEQLNRISLEAPSVPTKKVNVPVANEEDFKIEEKDSGDLDMADMKVTIITREFDEDKVETESSSTQTDKNIVETEFSSPQIDKDKIEVESRSTQMDIDSSIAESVNAEHSPPPSQQKEEAETEIVDDSQVKESSPTVPDSIKQVESKPEELPQVSDSEVSLDKPELDSKEIPDKISTVYHDDSEKLSHERESLVVNEYDTTQSESITDVPDGHQSNSINVEKDQSGDAGSSHQGISSSNVSLKISAHREGLEAVNNEESKTPDSTAELEKIRKEMKLMEAALQGAARQAQSKADEIARLMNENEHLKSTIEDLKRKSSEAEVDALREEYHQRVASLERKVYALTRERDTLRREHNKKSDAAALLKEKDEIISQVMAEGEELSKKQAFQESTIRKLRAQIREFEEEKQRLNSKLQVEETKVESIKKDKAATEKLLQETIEKNQAELAAQKEFYTNALNAAKEAEALAEARANNEAQIELERRLREASERESMLVQALEELRQTLSRTEQQAVFKEDMLRRDIDDLQQRYQASELRYNELVTQVPESTRPLLRQIEAMQETAARRAEAWDGVERALNSRLQEAEAKAAAAEEKERVMNERLSQSQSRITVLETQIACLRTEQTQLSRSLEKERQRASESRQEYLAAMEEAATQEGRAKQLEDEIKDLRSKQKRVLQEEMTKTELLEKELERERNARLELEKTASRPISRVNSQDHIGKLNNPTLENGKVFTRKLSSAGSLEESNFLQASLDSSDSFFSERRGSGEITMSPYFLKSMTPSAFEAALRQKDGELASYVSRLASLESIRDSLSEELVKMTEQCEKLRAEAAMLPGIRAELEALRRRHSSALELMGERDEALEELRNDIADLKEMYREQVDLLVNKIQVMSSSAGAA